MKIIIVGCGKVGVSLAERLSAEGHDLVMVDMNPQKVEHLSNQFDALGIVGNGASFNIQQEAGVEKRGPLYRCHRRGRIKPPLLPDGEEDRTL